MSKVKKQIDVVAAVIIHSNKYLCVQRGANKYDYLAYKYEFPGGKVELGELPEFALKREIEEELCAQIEVGERLIVVNYSYPDFDIRMNTYLCRFIKDPNFKLTEHIDSKWLSYNELDKFDWAAADLPIVQKLKEREME